MIRKEEHDFPSMLVLSEVKCVPMSQKRDMGHPVCAHWMFSVAHPCRDTTASYHPTDEDLSAGTPRMGHPGFESI